MRDIDRRRAVGALQFADLHAHVDAQLGVEIGERLVEHQQLRIDDERAGQRHALLLPARQRGGIALRERAEADAVQHGRDPPASLDRIDAALAQAEADIVGDAEMRKQRVVLEDEADVALVGGQARQVAVSQPDGARRRRHEAGDEAQGRRLAASARAEQRNELARADADGEVLQHLRGAVMRADMVERQLGRAAGLAGGGLVGGSVCHWLTS